jgi:hypothetical protein
MLSTLRPTQWQRMLYPSKSRRIIEADVTYRLLHDLGWDERKDSPFVTQERRFEVDSAIAAREFVRGHPDGKNWDDRKVQLMWDAIALHTEPSFFQYKEPEVSSTALGILQDFRPPTDVITQKYFDDIWAAYPGLKTSQLGTEKVVWLCRTKPSTTYGKSPTSYKPLHMLIHQTRGCNHSAKSLFLAITQQATVVLICF